jgi:two-component system, chemotaxis family, protein-glutamate methylesterase/glutaminase
VDDSPTIRLLIRTILERDCELTIVNEARSGEEAIAAACKNRPDLITMDINMPGMGGYEAIRQIMDQSPCPIVVLTGIESRHLMDVSFKALQLGALTVLPKPGAMSLLEPEAANLINQIKTMAAVKVIRRSLSLTTDYPLETRPQSLTTRGRNPNYGRMRSNFQLVAIGISTGGPPALQTLLSALPSSFPLPIVIVQHISKGFVASLAEWLSKTTPFACKVISMGEVLTMGQVYLAADNYHLTIQSNKQPWFNDEKPVDGLRPSVNMLFESVAKNFGANAIGVLMTGMGHDGAKGLLSMRRAGAYTIAQDEASSVIFGMPKEAIDLGAANEVLALEHIAPRLLSLVNHAETL